MPCDEQPEVQVTKVVFDISMSLDGFTTCGSAW